MKNEKQEMKNEKQEMKNKKQKWKTKNENEKQKMKLGIFVCFFYPSPPLGIFPKFSRFFLVMAPLSKFAVLYEASKNAMTNHLIKYAIPDDVIINKIL